MGIRVAVIAGIAGAAWALSVSAANAADEPDTGVSTHADLSTQPVTSSVLSLLTDVGTGTLRTLTGEANSAGTSATASSAAPASSAATASITDSVLAPVDGAITKTAAPLTGFTSHVLSEVLAPTNTVLAKGTAVPAATAGTNSNTAMTAAPRQTAEVPTDGRATDVVFGDAANQAASTKPGAPTGVVRDGADYVGSADLVRTVSDIVAPLGLTDLVRTPLDVLQPMIGMADPILAPLASVLSPVTAAVRWLAVPVTTTLGNLTRPATRFAMRSTVGAIVAAIAPAMAHQPATASLISSAKATPVVDSTTIAMIPVRVEAGMSAQRAYYRTGTHGTPLSRRHTIGAGERDLPGSPAPFPVPSGSDLGAISTTTSGSHEYGGSSAVTSGPVANGLAAVHQLCSATGVVARRLIVEVPTVSPD